MTVLLRLEGRGLFVVDALVRCTGNEIFVGI